MRQARAEGSGLTHAIRKLMPTIVKDHMVSDFAGIGNGFHDTNKWLRWLAKDAFPFIFLSQVHTSKLDELSHANIIEQIKNQDQNPSGR